MSKARLLVTSILVSIALGVSACSSPTAPDTHTLGPNNHTLGPNNHTLGPNNHTLGPNN